MKHALVILFSVALVCGILLAQETPPPTGTGSAQQQVPSPEQQNQTTTPPQTSSPAPQTTSPAPQTTSPAPQTNNPAAAPNAMRIAPGSVIPAVLTKTVDAKKVKKGDEVVAKIPQDLQASSGQVIVPKDTKVVGHVVEAQARSKEQKESQLAIAFDKMEMKNGEQAQIPMSIQAIIAPPNRNASNAGGGNEPPAASQNTGAGAPTSNAGGRGGTAGSSPTAPSAGQTEGSSSSQNQPAANNQPPITGETRGVVGIPNLTLSAAPDITQGSVVTSEKNNVKLEDGTFLLLRVNPAATQNPATPQNPPVPQK